MNVYDSGRMADVLSPLGYVQTQSPEDADLIILNTCHIREKATDKVFSELGRLNEHKVQKESTGGKMLIAVAGCVAQAEGKLITERAPYVDLVFGPQTYHRLPEMIAGAERERAVNTDFPEEPKFDYLPEEHLQQGSTAFLTIQEGCDKFCTYCVVPYTRGEEYSREVLSIVNEARILACQGVKEITLLGQNVNSYQGKAGKGRTYVLADLIAEISEINGIERIRYTTSHPLDMTSELIEAHSNINELMPFLHLPVQSGSDKILKLMNRKHKAEQYYETVESLRKARPDIALSSDFIVGFPGENEKDFEDTMKLVKDITFASAYSFIFSPRPGTPAASMPEIIPDEIKSERLQILQRELNRQQLVFNRNSVGKTLSVLFDRKGKIKKQIHGRTPYNQALHLESDCISEGDTVNMRITEGLPNSLRGEPDLFPLSG